MASASGMAEQRELARRLIESVTFEEVELRPMGADLRSNDDQVALTLRIRLKPKIPA